MHQPLWEVVMAYGRSYTTSGVPQENALETWREYMSAVYYRLDISPIGSSRVRGELHETQLNSIGISNFKSDAQRVIRYKEAAQIDGSENFVFLFPTNEKMHFLQLGKSGIFEPGEVVILNSAEDYTVTVPDTSENITLKIPCELLRGRVRSIDRRCARTGMANHHFAPIVSQMGQQLLKIQPTKDMLRIQDTLLELVGLMIEIDSDSGDLEIASEPLMNVLFEQLSGYIARHMRDPDLSPAAAATAHRISVRYLHKIFQSRGTTFGHELMEARLKEAHRLLTNHSNDRSGRLNIGQIAYSCGFVSQAHFSARYKERFDMTPRATDRQTGKTA
jgi:AraC family transcriptional activator of tynA and feaB